MVAKKANKLLGGKGQDILDTGRPQGRHHGEKIVHTKGFTVPMVPEVLPGRDTTTRIIGMEPQQGCSVRIEPQHVANVRIKGRRQCLGPFRKQPVQAVRTPLDRFPSVQTDAETHVRVLFFHTEFLEPFGHVGIVGMVKDHEANVDIDTVRRSVIDIDSVCVAT